MSKGVLIMSNIEAKVVTYLGRNEIGKDIHIVKEVSYEDGIYKDNIRVIRDYKRPFWITKEIYRDYKDKKEAEDIKKVTMYWSTESNLRYNIPKHLGDRYIGVKDLRTVKDSPYVYGIDVDSRTFLKRSYQKASNFASSPYRVGMFDIEVSILTDELLVATLATADNVYVYINKTLVKDIIDPIDKVREDYKKYTPKNKFNPQLHIVVLDNEIDVIKAVFKKANYASIDYLAVWNIDYDIPKVVSIIERYGLDPADIFHYDKIPQDLKYFKYIEGRRQATTASGKFKPINIEEQWHTVTATTNYDFIDAMAAHRYVRVGGKTVPGGYSFSNILKHEKVGDKLKYEDIDDSLQGPEWHNYMVAHEPIKYIVYNIWDTLAMVVLDDKTRDLSTNVPLLLGVSHLSTFSSGPTRIIDSLEFFYLKNFKVLGVRPSNAEADTMLGLKDWIVNLPAFLMETNGLKNIIEDPSLASSIRLFIYDADAVSSYPSNIMAANVSKDTTHREIESIGDINILDIKLQNMNLFYGSTNVVEYMEHMFKAPGLYTLLARYKEKNKEKTY